MVALDDLKPYARNARMHPEGQLIALEAIIRDSGFTAPLVIDPANAIIAGHGRALVAKRLGMAQVPCVRVTGLSDAQVRALRLSDNQSALRGEWDLAALLEELTALKDGGLDMALTAFDPAELGEIGLAGFGLDERMAEAEETPEPPANPVTAPGDLWILGDHRVLCGDSTNPKDVTRVAGGGTCDLCFTSPPYAQQRDYGAKITDWDGLMRGVFAHVPLSDKGQLLVNLGLVHVDGEWWPYWDQWIAWMREQGWKRFGWYVWDKLVGLPGDWNGRLAPAHEWIFHFNRASQKPNKTKAKKPESIRINTSGTGLRNSDGSMSGVSNRMASLQTHKIPDSVFRIRPQNNVSANQHPAMFPVALPKEVIAALSAPGGAVYEPFLGSGTTLIAAEMEGRKCYGIEIHPPYCEAAIRRWEDFTGKIAKREDGKTLDQLAKERRRAKVA
jgi:DNA modification methylase